MRVLLSGAIAAGLLAAGGLWLFGLRDSGRPAPTRAGGPVPTPAGQTQHRPRTYAELVAANYKVLSRAQSHRLIRFADEFAACVIRKGIALGDPTPSQTKIVMLLPGGLSTERLDQVTLACAEPLGGPPKDASLVRPMSGQRIELYLPKRCLLDRKSIAG
jgi:hypothetical protein